MDDDQGQPPAAAQHGVVTWGPGNRLWRLQGGRETSVKETVPEALRMPSWTAHPNAPLPEVGVGEGPDGLCLECERLISHCSNARSKQSLALLETVLRCNRESAEASVLAEALLPYVVEDLQDDSYALISALILIFSNPSTTTRRPGESRTISPPVNCAPTTGVEGDCYCNDVDGQQTQLGAGAGGADWFPGIAVGFYPSAAASTNKSIPPASVGSLGIPKNASSQSLRYGRGGGSSAGAYNGPGFLYMCKRPVSLRKIHSDLCISGAAPGSPWLRLPRSTATGSTDMRLTSSTSSISETTAPLPLLMDHREDGFGPDWTDIGASASFCNEWSYNPPGNSRTIEASTPNSAQAYPGCCSPSISNESLSPPSLLVYDRPSSPVMYVPQRCLGADGSFGSIVLPFLDIPKVAHIARMMEVEADRSQRFNDAAMLRCFLHALKNDRGRCDKNEFIIVAGEPSPRVPPRRGTGITSTLLMRVSDPDGNFHTAGGSWPDLTSQVPPGAPPSGRSLPADGIEDDASFSDESIVDIRSTVTKCAVCHEDVKGLATICNVCEHGGHVTHISAWFDQPGKGCPVLNCRCKCAF